MTQREQDIRQMLKAVFSKCGPRLSAHRVVLFGSRARGDARERSDFDLAVVGEQPLPLSDFFAIGSQLDALDTLYRFDWVDLARTHEKFRQSALAHTEVLYEA